MLAEIVNQRVDRGEKIGRLRRDAEARELFDVGRYAARGVVRQKAVLLAACADGREQLADAFKEPVAQVQRAVKVEEKELFALKKIMVNHQSRLLFAVDRNEEE